MRPIHALLRLTPPEHARLGEAAARSGMSRHAFLRDHLAPILNGGPSPFDRVRAWYTRRALDGLTEEREFLLRTIERLEGRMHAAEPGSLIRAWLREEHDNARRRLDEVEARTKTLKGPTE